ncbi:MAG: SDR family oxidoreductase, partial [Alphaproteobacteria bacterium]|nr:SDR family oxidoreductase [Alphaproteobacteria bacterium]
MSDTRPAVILTGASRGIGHATVKRFSDEGWYIITCSREDIPEHCKADPNWALHIPTDLSDTASVTSFIKKANEALEGRALNALVNNAAVSPKTHYKERSGAVGLVIVQIACIESPIGKAYINQLCVDNDR